MQTSETPIPEKHAAPDFSKGIVLDRVSFAYPDAGRLSVEEVSLRIPQGQHIAIVGENGAGKSTLAKLLLGVYQPTSGSVAIGGLETHAVNPETYQKHMSAVFQNFGRYQMTLSENVRISDFTGTGKPEELLEGTHEELLRRGGLYREMWEAQSGFLLHSQQCAAMIPEHESQIGKLL